MAFAAVGSTSALYILATFLLHFCPARETSVWAGKNESDAYGAEEMNYWVKWLGSSEFLLEEPKIIFLWNF